MIRYADCPQILKDFLSYHETIKGQSSKTIQEYYLDLRMFLRFMVLVKREMPYDTDLNTIEIKDVDLAFIETISVSDIFDFLSYLANDRIPDQREHAVPGIGSAARARKLSSIKSFYKYLTHSKQLDVNPVQDMEFPKIRKSLPRYLTLEQCTSLLKAVDGPNAKRDYAILMLFLNCGIRRAELVGLNLTDVYEDRIRVVGKGNKERIVYLNQACQEAISRYLAVRPKDGVVDRNALFLSNRGTRIKPITVEVMVKKYLEKIGLSGPGYSVHKLRHTAATLMYRYGNVDIRVLQDILGHTNLGTTEIYTHTSSSQMEQAVKANPLAKVTERRKKPKPEPGTGTSTPAGGEDTEK